MAEESRPGTAYFQNKYPWKRSRERVRQKSVPQVMNRAARNLSPRVAQLAAEPGDQQAVRHGREDPLYRSRAISSRHGFPMPFLPSPVAPILYHTGSKMKHRPARKSHPHI